MRDGAPALADVSLRATLHVWGELVEAYHGVNGYGGDTAEVYAYRLMPYLPTEVLNGYQPESAPRVEAEAAAARALYVLLRMFQERYECAIAVDGRTLGPWFARQRFDHRAHVRVTPKAGSVRIAIRRAVFERDGWRCQGCDVEVQWFRSRRWFGEKAGGHVDHIFARARGGQNDMENLQLLCERCNESKAAD